MPGQARGELVPGFIADGFWLSPLSMA